MMRKTGNDIFGYEAWLDNLGSNLSKAFPGEIAVYKIYDG